MTDHRSLPSGGVLDIDDILSVDFDKNKRELLIQFKHRPPLVVAGRDARGAASVGIQVMTLNVSTTHPDFAVLNAWRTMVPTLEDEIKDLPEPSRGGGKEKEPLDDDYAKGRERLLEE